MKKLSTINVIENANGKIALTAYPDNKEGNENAEKLFMTTARENGAEEIDLDTYIENGSYERGTYAIYLVHSN
ncbi:MAG TPA: hypothetical protein VJY62_15100 [Bacteroidia bacterium]|nr:hypothetical protein [Bacteroidia bacterium]